MAPTTDTGWIHLPTGEVCADPVTCTHDQTAESAELHGPNLAAVNLCATLRGVPFSQALIDSLRDWRDALDRQISNHAVAAASWLAPATDDVLPGADAVRYAESAHHQQRITTLIARRDLADHMLAGADDQHYR
ncbi:hypothetical protein [Gordonia rhizosphera]|uniref:Uncharacterized protein n=1 Tax=Gordonia rhizosphera NBRC 16068 TaxID=1108045 RepID=K6WR93_9ACTN|nr:hypothetical protein [Gordonia rhizosphera]GAB89079.1 hypothetical protein GORHZ_049_00120 [Gordonia rhizosphera NBRC 16068]